MRQIGPDMKTVTKAEARQQFDQLLDEVACGKISLTIEDDGKPVAVLLSVEQAVQRRKVRARVMETIREMQEAANVSPDEAEELAEEAVRAARNASERP